VCGEGLVLLIDKLEFAPHKNVTARDIQEYIMLLPTTVVFSPTPPSAPPELQESSQDLGLVKDRYLGATRNFAAHWIVVYGEVAVRPPGTSRVSVREWLNHPWVLGTTLLESLNRMTTSLTFTHGMRLRLFVPP